MFNLPPKRGPCCLEPDAREPRHEARRDHCSEEGSLEEQLLYRNVKRFRGGLVFEANRLVYHSTLGWRIIKKKKKKMPAKPDMKHAATTAPKPFV